MYQCILLVTLSMTSLVKGQDPGPFSPVPPSPGPCPRTPIIKDFNLHAYLGRWYEIERFFAPFQFGDCVTADYELFPNGSVSVVNTQREEGVLDAIAGIATLGPNPSEARLIVEFPNSPANVSPRGVPNYNVVATDYKNFAVVYSCAAFGETKFEFSWILARKPKIPASFLTALKDWLTRVNINAERYSPTFQDESCPRRPLPGQDTTQYSA